MELHECSEAGTLGKVDKIFERKGERDVLGHIYCDTILRLVVVFAFLCLLCPSGILQVQVLDLIC